MRRRRHLPSVVSTMFLQLVTSGSEALTFVRIPTSTNSRAAHLSACSCEVVTRSHFKQSQPRLNLYRAISSPQSAKAAIDPHTDHLINLLSSQHDDSPQTAPEPPRSHSPRRESSPALTPTRALSPPPPTQIPPPSSHAPHPRPTARLSPELSRPALPPSPPPPASLSLPAACSHTVTATSPSAPKSTIASYIHRFRTQPPLDEHERHKRLQQHHELPHRDFWWLRRYPHVGRDERGQAAYSGRDESNEEAAETTNRSVSGGKSRLSILPAIEAVLSEEERRVTAELARWSRPQQSQSHMSTQPPRHASTAAEIAPTPDSHPASNLVSQPTVPSSFVTPTTTPSLVSHHSTAASLPASSTLPPPQPPYPSLAQQVSHSASLAASPESIPPLPGASATHRDNIIRLARELRLPGLSSIAARDLPATLPTPQANDQWIAAPLADSYSLIPRRVGQWTALSPSRVSAASPLLSSSTASSLPSSHAASTLSSRATTEDDVDVDDILAQWRRTHHTAQTQQVAQPSALHDVDSRQRTKVEAKPEHNAVGEVKDKQANIENVV